MKTNPDQLARVLQKHTLAPIYLVTGDEPLMSGESCDLLRAFFREQGFTEREVHHVDASFSWDLVLQNTNALSLFAERKVIEVRMGQHKLNKADSQHLQMYLKNPAPDTAFLLVADKLDGTSKKSAWYKEIESLGLVVEIWPPEPEQLPSWLAGRATRLGITLSQDATALLADRIEGNLLAAQQELDKLQLLYPNQSIGVDEISAAVSDSSRYDVFTLIDAALGQQPERCLKILHVLRHEGTEAAVTLWAITRELRSLLAVSNGLASGIPYDTLCQRERIWGKRKKHLQQACRRLPSHLLEQQLKQCMLADRAIKGQRIDDPWLLMEQIIITLAGISLSLAISE
ncbi:DNA polymerase III subunit delta [Nitrincola sp. MINF-07-Sa-05]|uniref:DNA polymerase III subunit delta n=1 Tax=Nitrincola salilacus TaxID=3400273 RepID=UPI003917CA55